MVDIGWLDVSGCAKDRVLKSIRYDAESTWHDSDDDALCGSKPSDTELTPGTDLQKKGCKEGQAGQHKAQPFTTVNWLVHPTGMGDSTIE